VQLHKAEEAQEKLRGLCLFLVPLLHSDHNKHVPPLIDTAQNFKPN